MTQIEALQMAQKYCDVSCSECEEITGESRENCWIFYAKTALLYNIPSEPIVKGYRDTQTGKLERLYCPHCMKPIKNNKNFRYCPRCGKAIDWEE